MESAMVALNAEHLEKLLREAEAAHAAEEANNPGQDHSNWPKFYAEHMMKSLIV